MNSATITKISRVTANDPVDRLGALRAQIAELQEQAKPLETDIKARGPGKHEGQLFSATVAEVAPSESPDPAAMEAKLRSLGVDQRWFSKNLKVRAGYLRLSITDR